MNLCNSIYDALNNLKDVRTFKHANMKNPDYWIELEVAANNKIARCEMEMNKLAGEGWQICKDMKFIENQFRIKVHQDDLGPEIDIYFIITATFDGICSEFDFDAMNEEAKAAIYGNWNEYESYLNDVIPDLLQLRSIE